MLWREDLCPKALQKVLVQVGLAALPLAHLLRGSLAARELWGFIQDLDTRQRFHLSGDCVEGCQRFVSMLPLLFLLEGLTEG